ncbi:unnamed protein product, partial [Effrenium voratum]
PLSRMDTQSTLPLGACAETLRLGVDINLCDFLFQNMSDDQSAYMCRERAIEWMAARHDANNWHIDRRLGEQAMKLWDMLESRKQLADKFENAKVEFDARCMALAETATKIQEKQKAMILANSGTDQEKADLLKHKLSSIDAWQKEREATLRAPLSQMENDATQPGGLEEDLENFMAQQASAQTHGDGSMSSTSEVQKWDQAWQEIQSMPDGPGKQALLELMNATKANVQSGPKDSEAKQPQPEGESKTIIPAGEAVDGAVAALNRMDTTQLEREHAEFHPDARVQEDGSVLYVGPGGRLEDWDTREAHRNLINKLYEDWLASGEDWLKSSIHINFTRGESKRRRGKYCLKSYKDLKDTFGAGVARSIREKKKVAESKRDANVESDPWWMPHPETSNEDGLLQGRGQQGT